MDHFFDDERRQCREKTRSRVSNIQIWRSWIIRTFRFKFSLSSPADRITPIGPHSTDNARNVGVLTTKRDDRSTSFGEWTTNKYIRDMSDRKVPDEMLRFIKSDAHTKNRSPETHLLYSPGMQNVHQHPEAAKEMNQRKCIFKNENDGRSRSSLPEHLPVFSDSNRWIR